MSLGRPVDPPLVWTFQRGDTRVGKGSPDSNSSGTVPDSRNGQPWTFAPASPTISRASANSTMARNSAAGSFDDTIHPVAPSFHVANAVT